MYAICSHCYGSKNTAASALPLAPLFPFVYKISGWYCGGCLCALLRRVLAFFAGYFFSSTWLSITIFLQNMAIMTGRGHGHQHKWALIMVANGVILRYASNSKEQPNLVFSASRAFGAIRKPFFMPENGFLSAIPTSLAHMPFCRVMPSNDVGNADIDDTLGDTHDGPNRCVTLSSKGTPACSLIPTRRRMRLMPPTSASSSGNVMLHV